MHTTLIGNSCGTQREKGGREGEKKKEMLRQREKEREAGGRERVRERENIVEKEIEHNMW